MALRIEKSRSEGGSAVGGRRPQAPLRPPDTASATQPCTPTRDSDTRGGHRRESTNDHRVRESRVDESRLSRLEHDESFFFLSKHERHEISRCGAHQNHHQSAKTQVTVVRHHTHAKSKHSASSHPSLRERLNYLCRPRCSVDVVVGGGEHPLFMLLTSLLHRGGRLAQVRAAPRPRRSSSGDDDGELLG